MPPDRTYKAGYGHFVHVRNILQALMAAAGEGPYHERKIQVYRDG